MNTNTNIKVKIPFIMNGGDNKNIYNSEEIELNFKLQNLTLLGIIDKLTKKKEEEDKDTHTLIKASNTKDYYKNKNKK